MVHRLGRMDVPPDRGITPGPYAGSGQVVFYAPCLPADWDGFTVHYRFRETIYHIRVMQNQTGEKEAATVTVDGKAQQGKTISLVDDGQEHAVEVFV